LLLPSNRLFTLPHIDLRRQMPSQTAQGAWRMTACSDG
jgi:hypothetical protein